MGKKQQSDVINFMDLVWRAVHAADLPWSRVNPSLRSALELTVEAGFEFAPDDFSCVLKNYRSGFWISQSDEWFYAVAIMCDNQSAIASFEKHHSREAVIADNVELRIGFDHPRRKRCR